MSTVSFLRQALVNPRSVASVAPSGPALGRAMASAVPADARHIVELGPGTGPVTRALLESGIPVENLLAIERNRAMGLALSRQYPRLPVMLTDARHLARALRDLSWPAQVDAIVSSIPLRALDAHSVEQVITSANQCLAPGGVFIQYSYRAGSPVPSKLCERFNWKVEEIGKVWLNLPPARVYRYIKG